MVKRPYEAEQEISQSKRQKRDIPSDESERSLCQLQVITTNDDSSKIHAQPVYVPAKNLTQLVVRNKDLMFDKILPMLSAVDNITKLRCLNKQIKEVLTKKTRKIQFYNMVCCDLRKFNNEMKQDQQISLSILNDVSTWKEALEFIITNADFRKLRPFTTQRGSSDRAK